MKNNKNIFLSVIFAFALMLSLVRAVSASPLPIMTYNFAPTSNMLLIIAVLTVCLIISFFGYGILGGFGWLLVSVLMFANEVSFIISILVFIVGIVQITLFDNSKLEVDKK
jgi:fatty acid desaturase